MAKEKIGYRRLYDSVGCELENIDEHKITRSIDNIEIWVYFGSNPKLGIAYNKSEDKFVIPGEISNLFLVESMDDATKSAYPRDFFSEIICIKEVTVSDKLSDSFHSNNKDALNQILTLAKDNSEEFIRTADLLAGTIGLRFHRQFVLELISENYFCIKDSEEWPYQIESQALEILDGITLKTTGLGVVENNIELLSKAKKDPKNMRQQHSLGCCVPGQIEIQYLNFYHYSSQ